MIEILPESKGNIVGARKPLDGNWSKSRRVAHGGEVWTFDRDHLQEPWDWIKSHPSAGEIIQTSPKKTHR